MIARLHIQTKLREGITYLKDAYFTPPFKLADIREDKGDKTLQLVLMSSSPGILDGDEYHINVDVAENCSLRLTTQSYQRLFSMKRSASQQIKVNMAEGSWFCYLPHPTVPHEEANFISKSKIYLSDNCNLIWGETLTCGRKQNGEVFLFSRYQSLTEIYLNGKLIIKENLLIKPTHIDVNAIGQLENYTHQASLIALGQSINVKDFKESINAYLVGQTHITYGVTETPKNGILVRILGYKGEQLHNALSKITDIIQSDKKSQPIYA
jgi:urease accessory protein